jgi:hypothetical protein
LQEEEVERWGHIQYCKVPIPEKEARMGWGWNIQDCLVNDWVAQDWSHVLVMNGQDHRGIHQDYPRICMEGQKCPELLMRCCCCSRMARTFSELYGLSRNFLSSDKVQYVRITYGMVRNVQIAMKKFPWIPRIVYEIYSFIVRKTNLCVFYT